MIKGLKVYIDSGLIDPNIDSLCKKRLRFALYNLGVVSIKGISTETAYYISTPKENTEKGLRKIDIRYMSFSKMNSDSLSDVQKAAIAENNKIEEVAIWNDTKNPNARPKYNVPYLLNIKFIEGKSRIQGESFAELERLFKYLKDNPNLNVIIRGHVCCGNNDRISKNRAKAVFKELRKRGIDKSRMNYIGMSNRDPLVYPEVSNSDRQKNRRVDVKLILMEIPK